MNDVKNVSQLISGVINELVVEVPTVIFCWGWLSTGAGSSPAQRGRCAGDCLNTGKNSAKI